MHTPLYSTITLFVELVISSIIYYTLYQGYTRAVFPKKLASFALLYEILFNISYMVYRVPDHAKGARLESSWIIALAIVHGVLSLIMFIALLVFFFLAWKNYKKGVNFFKIHKTMTIVFTIFWTFSVLSGILFYVAEYMM